MIRNKVELKANFDELADFIGSAQGWSDKVKTPYYIADLIRAAHGVASQRFDVEAASVAVPLGFRHMYEWGTVGINPGESPIRPTNRDARLWVHRLTGTGANRGIDFSFRPSTRVVPVDPSLPESTRPGYVRHKHIFHGKAWVTEYGIPVVIKPKYAQALMIPVGEDVQPNGTGRYSNERALKRGYFMYNNSVNVPGSKNAGNFTMFWQVWWNTEGRRIIDETSQKMVDGSAKAVIKTGRGRGTALGKYAKGKAIPKAFSLRVDTARARAYAESRLTEHPQTRQWQLEEFRARGINP